MQDRNPESKTHGNTSGRNYPLTVSRKGFLLITGAIAVIAGLLFPLSTRIFDTLLIFSTSLAAAALIITFSARSALQVLGFPLLIVMATSLQIALTVASPKFILSQGNAGTVIDFFGNIVVRNNIVLAIFTIGLFVMAAFGAICKAVKDIVRNATHFVMDIVLHKEVATGRGLNARLINRELAANADLPGEIACEAGFFVAMMGAGRFMLWAAVIALGTIIVNVVGSLARELATSTTMQTPTKTYATLAIGAGIAIQIPALLAALASKYLVRRSMLDAVDKNELSQQESFRRIKVVSNEVMASQRSERQYDSTISYAKSEQGLYSESDLIGNKAIIEELEWDDESRRTEAGGKKDNFKFWVAEEINDSDSYEAAAELLRDKSPGAAKTILMAAENTKELPVTIPVNVAMRLACRGHRCLLIDLDIQRNAMSKVFDIDRSKGRSRATKTSIGNLWVWPATNFCKDDTAKITKVIDGLEAEYDHLIVYAPSIKLLTNPHELACSVKLAMLFASPPTHKNAFENTGPGDSFKHFCMVDFHTLLTNYACEVLAPPQTPVEAL